MPIVQRITHEAVEGLRAGRFDFGLNTASTCFRLGDTLIDTGCANRWSQVRAFVTERPLRQVLLTHHHEDHSGNATRIWRQTGARILAPQASLAPLLQGWSMRPYQRLLFGRPQRVAAKPVPDRLALADGFSLQTIATPGHAADLVCYLEPERGWLFTGDLFISERTRFLRRDEELEPHMASLHRLLGYDFETIFCAHRGVVDNAHAALAAKIEHLETLCGEARRLRQQGLSAKAITLRLLGREERVSLVTGWHFTKRNLINACLKLRE